MIVPAAGQGSRLGAAIPKVLFPVKGRPMLDHLFDLYASVVDGFAVVLDPSTRKSVQRHCEGRDLRIEYAVQREPTGMLDAVLTPSRWVERHGASQVWITWCDQIAVHPETVSRLAALATHHDKAAIVLPTIMKNHPYVHLVRDRRGGIAEVRHRREHDTMPPVGENDLGLFSLSRSAYLRLLPAFAAQAQRSTSTGERNFLPFLAWVSGRAEVRTFSGRDETEAVGINTVDDLKQVEQYLDDDARRAVGHHSSL